MIGWKEDHNGINITQVQLTDIEDAAHVPPVCDILGRQVGNEMWRSPEAHAHGRVNRPSDIFSFGVVVSFPARHSLLRLEVAAYWRCRAVYLRGAQESHLCRR